MIVRGDYVTLTKKELDEVIIKCSARAHAKAQSKTGINVISFIMMQSLLTMKVVEEVNKKIFGEENND